MKRYITRSLKTVALSYMAFPLGYVLGATLLFDIPGQSCVSMLLSPSYYVVSALAFAAGYGIWEMRRWSWYLFVVANLAILYENALILGEYSASHHKTLAFAIVLVGIVGIVFRVAREIRVPYFFPKIRWWESDPRYRLSVPVSVSRGDAAAGALAAEIMDLSLGGCFVKLRQEIREDEAVALEFTIFGEPIVCEGVVVWKTQSTVTHPRGVGIKFTSLGRKERRSLKMITRRLKKISAFYRRSRYLLNQDEFLKRLEELESGPSSAD